ncbi:MAG TPA: hypothetical protein VM935_10565 [Chitinophagaceae bacterium]|jgi:hypothetical protein|nr:hypothetical protein [Chitinophagaceae bacterium]
MKGFLFILSSILVIAFACSKDKFKTKPTLDIKSFNTKNIQVGNDLNVNLEFTDKEGDVDSVIYVIRQRINRRAPLTRNNDYTVPSFPKTTRGEILVSLDNARQLTQGFSTISLPGSQVQDDTMNIKFVLKDRAGNTSDTAVLTNVVIKRQ